MLPKFRRPLYTIARNIAAAFLPLYRIAVMRILRQPTNCGSVALAIGNFDGCHAGHRALLRQTRQAAADAGLPFAVLTFEPHPLAVLRPGCLVRRIGGARDKMMKLAGCGVNLLYLARFDNKMAATSAEAFCRLLFDARAIGAKVVAVGDNFRFGKGRAGDVNMLRRIAEGYGAKVLTAALTNKGGAVVSSGRIRAAIAGGEFDDAAALLGNPWLISGRVVRGKGLGASLGFPTANIRAGFVPPCCGIFAAMVYDNADIGKSRFCHPAAVSIGANPTVRDDGGISIEAHLPGFGGDLYGRRLVLRLCRKLRDEKHYESRAALTKAIGDDVRAVQQLLSGEISSGGGGGK